MLIAGPELMQIAFGDKFTYDRVDLLIVTAGMGLYLSAATLNQAALAQGQVRQAAAVCWIACAIAFIVWTAVPLVDDEFLPGRGRLPRRGGACSAPLLFVLYRRPHREEDTIEPGSTEEIELQLAAADEGGP